MSAYDEAITDAWKRTYKNPDGTEYQVAYRAKTTFIRDSNDNPIKSSFVTEIQTDPSGNGGNLFATWKTGATRGADGKWVNATKTDANTKPLGADSLKDLSKPGPNSFNQQINNNTAYELKRKFEYTDTQAYDVLNKSQKVVKPAPQPNKPPPAAAADTAATPKDINSFAENIASVNESPRNFGKIVYPESSETSKLFDYIEFTAYEYGKSTINSGGIGIDRGQDGQTRSVGYEAGSVRLPIQSGITDSNSVGWNEQSANSLQLMGAQVSLGGQNGDDVATQVISKVQESLGDKGTSSSISSMLKLYFASEAVKANIATKFTGAIINPNVELLFNAPQLRPFTFNFKLSPRNQTEATRVKRIIRFFKQNMAVRRGVKDLFLKSPNVFKIKYLYNKETQHGGLNLFKTCALQNFIVDYTPDGSYATFYEDKGNGTMVSYNISLTFMELEPIYADDYPDDKTIIGY
jgi:hypothetical protein